MRITETPLQRLSEAKHYFCHNTHRNQHEQGKFRDCDPESVTTLTSTTLLCSLSSILSSAPDPIRTMFPLLPSMKPRDPMGAKA